MTSQSHLCTTTVFTIREMSNDELSSFRGSPIYVQLLKNQVAIGGTHVKIADAALTKRVEQDIRNWLRENSTEMYHLRQNDGHYIIIKLYSEADKLGLVAWWDKRQDTYNA